MNRMIGAPALPAFTVQWEQRVTTTSVATTWFTLAATDKAELDVLCAKLNKNPAVLQYDVVKTGYKLDSTYRCRDRAIRERTLTSS